MMNISESRQKGRREFFYHSVVFDVLQIDHVLFETSIRYR